eukprot:Opistho-2@50155
MPLLHLVSHVLTSGVGRVLPGRYTLSAAIAMSSRPTSASERVRRSIANLSQKEKFGYKPEDDKSNMDSIHTAHIKDIHEVPMSVITRPLPSELCEPKVKSLMGAITDESARVQDVPPIDILWVQGSEGGNYYFAFGGCHRFEAHKRLGKETIRAKLVPCNEAQLKIYLGNSAPTNLK